MAYEKIDLETPQPNGKVGEPLPTALARVRRMFVELYKLWQTNPNVFPYFDKDGNPTFSALTEFARSIMDDPDAATVLKTLGLGTPSDIGKALLVAADVAAARDKLGLNLVKPGANFSGIPRIGPDAVMDIGQIIDFHDTNAGTEDFSGRLSSFGGNIYWGAPALGQASRAMYHQSNVLGAVGQTNGIPNGSLIESGSNANGEYVRFANGTQICRRILTTAFSMQNQAGSALWFSAGTGRLPFPAAFVGEPFFMAYPRNVAGYFGWVAMDSYVDTNTSPNMYMVSPSQSFNGYLSYMAYGRWY